MCCKNEDNKETCVTLSVIGLCEILETMDTSAMVCTRFKSLEGDGTILERYEIKSDTPVDELGQTWAGRYIDKSKYYCDKNGLLNHDNSLKVYKYQAYKWYSLDNKSHPSLVITRNASRQLFSPSNRVAIKWELKFNDEATRKWFCNKAYPDWDYDNELEYKA